MNIKEYIQSGIIESYVLGLADEGEVRELEQLRTQYPEVGAAIQTFELELEQAAMANGVPVDPDVKEGIYQKLNLKERTEQTSIEAKTFDSNVPELPARKSSFVKYLAAASIVLLVFSAALNIYTYSKYKNLVAENKQLALQRNQLYANNNSLQTKMDEVTAGLKDITGTDVIKVALTGVPGKEGNEAVVYWSKNTKGVYISVKNLPAAPAGKQYQLWALNNGKPIDAGVLGDCNTVCKLKNIQNAQAFAITLEDKGGSPTPHLEQLYVMGKI